MRLLTWNLNGNDDAHVDVRTEAAVFTMVLGARLDQLHAGAPHALPPDVIVLQEVTARMFASNIAKHLPAGGYKLIPTTPPDREIFEVIAFRDAVRFVDYDIRPLVRSNYGRALHEVQLETAEGSPVRILTAHFDSGTESAKIRQAQLAQVAERVDASTVFAGDANLRKAEWEATRDSVTMRDAWEVLGQPADTRVTWERDDYKARFDRLFVGTHIEPTAMRAYGRGSLPGLGVPISDHVGLVLDFTFRTTETAPQQTHQ